MNIDIKLDEADLKKLVLKEIQRLAGDLPIKIEDIQIETKSKQNFRSDWEQAAFRASIVRHIA